MEPVRTKRILILDDDLLAAQLLAAMIKSLGDTEICERGSDALARLRLAHFDAVISDYDMPEMNGIDFYHEAIAIDPALGRRFLFFTGADDNRFIQMVENHGVMFLRKPSSMGKLQCVVTRLLGNGP